MDMQYVCPAAISNLHTANITAPPPLIQDDWRLNIDFNTCKYQRGALKLQNKI